MKKNVVVVGILMLILIFFFVSLGGSSEGITAFAYFRCPMARGGCDALYKCVDVG